MSEPARSLEGDPDSVRSAFASAERELGGLDVLEIRAA